MLLVQSFKLQQYVRWVLLLVSSTLLLTHRPSRRWSYAYMYDELLAEVAANKAMLLQGTVYAVLAFYTR